MRHFQTGSQCRAVKRTEQTVVGLQNSFVICAAHHAAAVTAGSFASSQPLSRLPCAQRGGTRNGVWNQRSAHRGDKPPSPPPPSPALFTAAPRWWPSPAMLRQRPCRSVYCAPGHKGGDFRHQGRVRKEQPKGGVGHGSKATQMCASKGPARETHEADRSLQPQAEPGGNFPALTRPALNP